MTETTIAEALQDHSASRHAFLRDQIASAAGKVCSVDLDICGQARRLRLDFNAWCEVERDASAPGPVQAYRQIVDGRSSAALVRAVILNGLKCGSGDPEFKPGPIVDRLLAEYPFAVAQGIAEVVVAAWLVGVDKPTEA